MPLRNFIKPAYSRGEELPIPLVPYVRGWKFTVQSHIPPPPTPVISNNRLYTPQDATEYDQLGGVEWLLKNAPLPGKKGVHSITLEIVENIRNGDRLRAQVFAVIVRDATTDTPSEILEPDRIFVAKVYDPLYHADDVDVAGFISPIKLTDHDYTHECAVYEKLSEYQGKRIPRFYGSFSLDIPFFDKIRTVRLILIEYIPGTSMDQANAADFSQHTRQQMIKSIINFESDVFGFKDIKLLDLHRRNILIMKDTQHNLVFIDFADCLFNRRPDEPRFARLNTFLGQYISPLLRCTGKSWKAFKSDKKEDNWIDWDMDAWVNNQWAHTKDTITPEMVARFG
ncbi:hypothetical protein N7495_001338 [Penicillium taxi]|uniref:uncharacterized protein n=1 Tax=Penicillium taxi TaxID=168475 RepID=UPI0025454599|nr:uncharacterized protein N7495_001338 [Penicillium taxi]KAJ5908656.1 hypothetical protein N7495_001338 [Penicillium taxi]